MTKNNTCTYVSIDQVVIACLKNRPIVDYQAEAARIAHYYAAGIIAEPGEIIVTEEAVVVSIETAVLQTPW
jgi:hypothetical protein